MSAHPAPEFGDGDGGGEARVDMATFVLALFAAADREGPFLRAALKRLIERVTIDLTSEGDE